MFSQLNNLTDLTLDPVYSSICGYTEGDLETVFAPELGGLDREQVREWYNGYSWLGDEKVYNPYDVLLLRGRRFAAHWFETGTPAFLVDTLFERRVSTVSLDQTVSTAKLLSAFDVGSIGTDPDNVAPAPERHSELDAGPVDAGNGPSIGQAL